MIVVISLNDKIVDSNIILHIIIPMIIELDDGKNYRKALYLMVKTMASG